MELEKNSMVWKAEKNTTGKKSSEKLKKLSSDIEKMIEEM